MATALVVGGTGYIGFEVAKALRREGWKVYGTARSEEKALNLSLNEIFPITITDVDKDLTLLKTVLPETTVLIDALEYDQKNECAINRKILDLFASFSTPYSRKTYLYTSDVLVLGDHPGKVIDEDTPFEPLPFLKPRFDFEEVVVSHPKINGIVIRPGFVFGKNAPKLLPEWWNPDPETPIRGVPSARWSWVHIEDLADAYAKVAQKRSSLRGEIFNIGTETAADYATIRNSQAQVSGVLKPGQQLKFVGLSEEDKKGFTGALFQTAVISSTKARNVLGWAPKHLDVLNELEVNYQVWLACQKKQGMTR